VLPGDCYQAVAPFAINDPVILVGRALAIVLYVGTQAAGA